MRRVLVWYVRPMNRTTAWYLEKWFPHIRNEYQSIGDSAPQTYMLGIYEQPMLLSQFARLCLIELGEVLCFVSYCRHLDEPLARRLFTYNAETIRVGMWMTPPQEQRAFELAQGWPLQEGSLQPRLAYTNGNFLEGWETSVVTLRE